MSAGSNDPEEEESNSTIPVEDKEYVLCIHILQYHADGNSVRL